MAHQRFPDGTEAAGGYARAVKAGPMVFVAGTTSLNAAGEVQGADAYEQTRITYEKIGAALAKAGAKWSDVTRITAYLTDMDQADGFSRAHVERFPGKEVPAAALIGIPALLKPGLLIEIEATAVIEGESLVSETVPFDAADLQKMFDASPFISALGLEVLSVTAETLEVEVRMPMIPSLERLPESNKFHGGPIASLIDTTGDFAVGLAVGGGVPTIDLRIDYLRPAFGPYLTAHATARRVGKTIGIADVDVFGADGKLVAIGRGCYSAKRG